jgi:hypothetical protein
VSSALPVFTFFPLFFGLFMLSFFVCVCVLLKTDILVSTLHFPIPSGCELREWLSNAFERLLSLGKSIPQRPVKLSSYGVLAT